MSKPRQTTPKAEPAKPGVQILSVSEHQEGQRLDNFLLGKLKGVPKSLIYRVVRKGEVRVNGKRAKPEQRLVEGDQVRIPPVRLAEAGEVPKVSGGLADKLRGAILFQDEHILVLDKPSGLPVHAGTGVKLGVIEALRQLYPEWPALELVHRIDKGTSGCLLLAKTGKARRALMSAFRSHEVSKAYHAIVIGKWPDKVKRVEAALARQPERGGERRVEVDEDDGKEAVTEFTVLKRLARTTLIEARPLTGRTHQIRVHAASTGCPLLGDEKYADEDQARLQQQAGSKRLFLHASRLRFAHPDTGKVLEFTADYDEAFAAAVKKLG